MKHDIKRFAFWNTKMFRKVPTGETINMTKIVSIFLSFKNICSTLNVFINRVDVIVHEILYTAEHCKLRRSAQFNALVSKSRLLQGNELENKTPR